MTTGIALPSLAAARIRPAGNSTFDVVFMARSGALLWRPHVGDRLIFVASGR
jgi:hypothetical protein